MIDRVFGHDPGRFVVVVSACIQVAFVVWKITAGNLQTNFVAFGEVPARYGHVYLHFIDLALFHPDFPG